MKDNTTRLLAESYLETRKPKVQKNIHLTVLENIVEDCGVTEDMLMQEGIWDTVKQGASALAGKVKQGAQAVGGAIKQGAQAVGGAASGMIGKLIQPFIQKIIGGLDDQTKQRLAQVAQNPQQLQAELQKVAKEGEQEAKADMAKLNQQDQAASVANDPAASAAGVPGSPGQAPSQVNASTEITLGQYRDLYESYVREFQYVVESDLIRKKLEDALSRLNEYVEGYENVVLENTMGTGLEVPMYQNRNPQTGRYAAGMSGSGSFTDNPDAEVNYTSSNFQDSPAPAPAPTPQQNNKLRPDIVAGKIFDTLETFGVDTDEKTNNALVSKFANDVVKNHQSIQKAGEKIDGKSTFSSDFEKVKRWFSAPGNEKRGKVALGLLTAVLGYGILPMIATPMAAALSSVALKAGAPISFRQFG